MFGGGGRGAFGLGVGAGFIGGAVAGVAAMETYHRYRQYRAMMYYGHMHHGSGFGYGGYGGYVGYGRNILCDNEHHRTLSNNIMLIRVKGK